MIGLLSARGKIIVKQVYWNRASSEEDPGWALQKVLHVRARKRVLQPWVAIQASRCAWRVERILAVKNLIVHINSLVQDCSNSSALAMELLQSCTKPSMCFEWGSCASSERIPYTREHGRRYSNAFTSLIWICFHWISPEDVLLTKSRHFGLDYVLVPHRRQAIV